MYDSEDSRQFQRGFYMCREFIINKYLGIPYINMGRDIKGVDCWGLVVIIFKDILNVDLPDTLDKYEIDWSYKGKNYFNDCYVDRFTREITPQYLDIILIKNSKGISNHAGVMVDSKHFIHAAEKAGVIVSNIKDSIWINRIEGYFRLKT